MKNILKKGSIALLAVASLFAVSCNKFLDMKPISQLTPLDYLKTTEQLDAYVLNYYNTFLSGYYHDGGWNDGLIRNDNNTDIFLVMPGNVNLFTKGLWLVGDSKNLSGYFARLRVCNYFINNVEARIAANEITGSEADVNSVLGEMYFFRAFVYFDILKTFGDFPIIKEVLPDEREVLVTHSTRAPRNEVARFILEDLDKAISMLKDRNVSQGRRVNKEVALLVKSRVALYEGTFEKYHKGTGRVPGDSNWPGASASYNAGKTFNIDEEVKFFLTEARSAAEQVADNAVLTPNSHVINPTPEQIKAKDYYSWNPYFAMFSRPSLADVPEVLLWKEYSMDEGIRVGAPYRIKIGANDGYTRVFAESFLTKTGRPIYDAESGYMGDSNLDKVKENRDERLQLFVWSYNNIYDIRKSKAGEDSVAMYPGPDIMGNEVEKRCATGYQPRKYYTYDPAQTSDDDRKGVNACPIFRSAEALINYVEADVELTNALSSKSRSYWSQLRERAGIAADIDVTIHSTNVEREKDFGAYSGSNMVSALLYNVRRERMNEFFGENFRYDDLIRWRSFDKMLTEKYIPEGYNFWDEEVERFKDEEGNLTFTADGSSSSIISQQSSGKYLRPLSANMTEQNSLRDGYIWTKAYYLSPIFSREITLASPDGTHENSNMYQNPYWPSKPGAALE